MRVCATEGYEKIVPLVSDHFMRDHKKDVSRARVCAKAFSSRGENGSLSPARGAQKRYPDLGARLLHARKAGGYHPAGQTSGEHGRRLAAPSGAGADSLHREGLQAGVTKRVTKEK